MQFEKKPACVPKETFSQKMSQPCMLWEQDLKKAETKAIHWIFPPHTLNNWQGHTDGTRGDSFKLKEGGYREGIFSGEGGEAFAQVPRDAE